ncbi:uncharacterized protein [Dendrobates tinctorius]|uniref:uncharacterized protein n=1 Tax=Dendrobates tinctorius TaxID=92724 RepID=UPI003CC9A501
MMKGGEWGLYKIKAVNCYLLDSEMAFTSGVQSRNKDKLFLVGYPIHQITGCKLPSNRQVLCALFYNLRTVKLTVRESAKLTIREVFIFLGKARIPTKHEQDAVTKLEKLHAEWRSLQKDRKKTSETAKNKFKQFVEKLNDLFDIAQQDALALMKLEEDKAFLVKQRQKGRPGSMAGVDLKLSRAEEIKAQKELAKMNRQIQEETFDIETDDEDKLEEGKEEEDTEEDSIYQELESLEEMDIPEEVAEDPGPSESKRMKDFLLLLLSLITQHSCSPYGKYELPLPSTNQHRLCGKALIKLEDRSDYLHITSHVKGNNAEFEGMGVTEE